MRLKYFLLSFLIIGFVCQLSFAQVSVLDKQGDKIIVMPDGTWQYADQDKQASVNNTVKEQQKTGQANIDKSKLSKAEKKQIEEQAKADERRKKIAAKLAKQEQAKQPKNKNADKNKTVAKENTDKKNKGTDQKNTKPKKEENKKNTVQTTDKKPVDKKNTDRKEDKDDSITTEKKPVPKVSSSDAKTVNTKKTNSSTTVSNAKVVSNKQDVKQIKQGFKPFKASQIIVQEAECTYTVNEIDPFTGKRKVALENKFFFGFTHPQLEKYLKGEHYLTCDGYLQQVSGMKIFNVKFTVDSPNAVDDYGSILEGSRMLVSLLDGSTVTLISAEEDGGKIDRIDKTTTYKTYFVIDAKQEKQLLKSEINQVRMVWSEGFEDYEIHEVDFLMSQLKCLNNIPK